MPLKMFIVVKTILLKSIYLSQPYFKTEKPRNTNSITHRTIQNCWTNQNSFKARTISTIFSIFSLLKISQLISETNGLTPNGYLKGLLIYKYVFFQQHTLQEINQNFQTTSSLTHTFLVQKKIEIIIIDRRTISASFVVLLLVNLVKRIITVIRKLKNCSINIVNISEWNP